MEVPNYAMSFIIRPFEKQVTPRVRGNLKNKA